MFKKIFITGAAGFIGSHLSEKLYDYFSKSQLILFDKITYAANKKYQDELKKDYLIFLITNQPDVGNKKNTKKNVDEIVIGSAIIKIIEENLKNKKEIIKKISKFSKKISEATKI